MKILGIVPYRFLPAQIGGQKAIEQLYCSLGKKVPVFVVSTQNNDAVAAKHFSFIPLFNNHLLRYGNFFYLKSISKIVLEHSITHLFTEHPYMGWMALYLKKRYKISLVVHSHNIESIRFKSLGKKWWRLLWYYERFIYRAADYVFFITDADRQYAIKKYGLSVQKTHTAFYGTEVKEAPLEATRKEAKETICEALQIGISTPLLLFNGSFDYAPNRDALQILIEDVVPSLNKKSYSYRLIVCGKNIPQQFKDKRPKNVTFLDYVDDIFHYNLAADVFLNPVVSGGGIKTKLVEALSAGANAVSSKSGAIGVDTAWCNNKLYLAEDGDWHAFEAKIYEAVANKNLMSEIFYQHFFIDNIANNIIEAIN